MKYVFGPVPSRRLGKSLGIDTIPLKTCNWNCVYCQLGRTKPLTNLRKRYFDPADILEEVRLALASHRPGDIDWVTFVGSGEPLLHVDMGWLLRQVKNLTALPVAVITNGSLFYLPEVRQELAVADAVLPSLDAGTAKSYRHINRPHPEVTFLRHVDGLRAFREEYQGKLWVEVMLVDGSNDSQEALVGIADVLATIKPDSVHLNLPTRPPVESWVKPPDEERLMRAVAILGKGCQVVRPGDGEFDLGETEDPLAVIMAIITRHPMREVEIERALSHWSEEEILGIFASLAASGQAQVVERYGVRFWTATPSIFPPEEQSLRTSPGAVIERIAQSQRKVNRGRK